MLAFILSIVFSSCFLSSSLCSSSLILQFSSYICSFLLAAASINSSLICCCLSHFSSLSSISLFIALSISMILVFPSLLLDPFACTNNCCDAPKPGGPLTTRQPAEFKWMSGYPTPLQKIGQSLLCTGSSTQIQYL